MNIQIIAKRYAGALFSEIKEKNESPKIWEELSNLAELVKTNKEFANIVKNPTVTDSEKISVFSSLNNSGKISKSLFNFVSLLVEKKRLFLLEEVDAEIKRIILSESGVVEAEAVFASMPDSKEKAELEKQLSTVTGKKILLKESVDPSLIGGVKVRLGSVLYDATIKGQLDKLKASLI